MAIVNPTPVTMGGGVGGIGRGPVTSTPTKLPMGPGVSIMPTVPAFPTGGYVGGGAPQGPPGSPRPAPVETMPVRPAGGGVGMGPAGGGLRPAPVESMPVQPSGGYIGGGAPQTPPGGLRPAPVESMRRGMNYYSQDDNFRR